tara:strand:+ start:2651 stop:2833 length:183 start_codon:yes stop_codon:yes gene_type:complete
VIVKYKIMGIKTEITELTRYKNQYENALTENEFQEAENYLCKVHDKYGTIDEKAIKNLIR